MKNNRCYIPPIINYIGCNGTGYHFIPQHKNTQNLNYYQNINYQQFMEHKQFDLVLWKNRKRNIDLKKVYKIEAIDYESNKTVITESYRATICLSDEAPILPHIGISTSSYLVSIDELKPYEPEPEKHAIISDCKKYRFALHREWDDSKPTAMFIMQYVEVLKFKPKKDSFK